MMLDKLKHFLDGPVNPIVYIFVLLSGFSGYVFAFMTNSPEVKASPIYSHGLMLGFNAWGIFLLVGSILMLVGLIWKRRLLVMPGAMIAFCMWLFAVVSYVGSGLYLGVVGLFTYVLIFAYIYLASAFDLLRHRHIEAPPE